MTPPSSLLSVLPIFGPITLEKKQTIIICVYMYVYLYVSGFFLCVMSAQPQDPIS